MLCLLLFGASSLVAQAPDSLQREAISKLNWWVGNWKGMAWSSMGPSRRDTTLMTEKIKKDLDGTILIVEGVGRRKGGDQESGAVVHHALAVLSYNEKKQSYRWQAWRIPGGIYTETEPEVAAGRFHWTMETPRGKMRYTIVMDEKGEWKETGEYSAEGGTWRQFFGMILSRED